MVNYNLFNLTSVFRLEPKNVSHTAHIVTGTQPTAARASPRPRSRAQAVKRTKVTVTECASQCHRHIGNEYDKSLQTV